MIKLLTNLDPSPYSRCDLVTKKQAIAVLTAASGMEPAQEVIAQWAVAYARSWIGLGCIASVEPFLQDQPCPVCFARHCEDFGLSGYPVEALYESYFGKGCFEPKYKKVIGQHEAEAFSAGKEAAKLAMKDRLDQVDYEGPCPEFFEAGMSAYLDELNGARKQ